MVLINVLQCSTNCLHMRNRLSLQQGWNGVSSGKAVSILLYYTTSVSQISIPLETTCWQLPLVWLQTYKASPAKTTSIHHSAHGAQASTVMQRAFKTLFGYRAWSRHQGGNQSHHAPGWGWEMEEGKAWLDLITSEMTTMKCDPGLRLSSKVASVLLNRWHTTGRDVSG